MSDIQIFETLPELHQAAANEITRLAHARANEGREFTIALSGGSTPRGIFALMADNKTNPTLPWDMIHFIWGDERHVPPDHPESNFRMADETLLSLAPVPEENIHRIRGELDNPYQAAELYEEELRAYFQISAGEWPRFDLVLLGMGPDGHTASLFPGTQALLETSRLVAPNWVGKFDAWRITLTVPVINHAARVLVLVAGADKASVLSAVMHGPHEPGQLPIQLVQPLNGNITWMVDRNAAAKLPESP